MAPKGRTGSAHETWTQAQVGRSPAPVLSGNLEGGPGVSGISHFQPCLSLSPGCPPMPPPPRMALRAALWVSPNGPERWAACPFLTCAGRSVKGSAQMNEGDPGGFSLQRIGDMASPHGGTWERPLPAGPALSTQRAVRQGDRGPNSLTGWGGGRQREPRAPGYVMKGGLAKGRDKGWRRSGPGSRLLWLCSPRLKPGRRLSRGSPHSRLAGPSERGRSPRAATPGRDVKPGQSRPAGERLSSAVRKTGTVVAAEPPSCCWASWHRPPVHRALGGANH